MPAASELSQRIIRSLRQRILGEVLVAGDNEYDSARRVYNGMVDRRPFAIIRCRELDDIRCGLEFARANELLLAVRGGGHSVAGFSTVDSGIVLDLSLMNTVRIESAARTVTCGPGATWGDFDSGAGRFGLATTGGIVPDTGVAGLTLGGGLGWLMGLHALACDNLRGVEVVTADGRVVTAGYEDNPDLFWALRGGGGNFGIVTSFTFDVHPVSRVVAGSLRVPLPKALEALDWYQAWGPSCPDWLTISPALINTARFGPHLSLDLCAVTPSRSSLIESMLPVNLGFHSSIAEREYVEWQADLRDPYRRGRRSYWKSLSAKGLSIETLKTLVAAFSNAPSKHTMITIDHVHGAAARVAADATAYGARAAPYVLLLNSIWESPDADAKNIAWTRSLFDTLTDARDGASAYVNYLDADDQGRLHSAYMHLQRLRAIKSKYDPDNVFRLNQNISPISND